MEKLRDRKARAGRIAAILAGWYPDDVRAALDWRNPVELLVSTILAAQATDVKVNEIAPALYARFPDPAALAGAPVAEVEDLVRQTGFFRNKARAVQACCRALLDRHGGEVPGAMEDLVALPGVGRKTANVVRTNCFGLPGIVVDTHVIRLSARLGLTDESDPEKIERDLMALLPEAEWSAFCHRLTWLGRRVCTARKPAHAACRLLPDCPTGKEAT